MRHLLLPLAAVVAVASLVPAVAQSSTGAPLSSQKEETEGDPTGAIRALERSSEGKTSQPVTIPRIGPKASKGKRAD